MFFEFVAAMVVAAASSYRTLEKSLMRYTLAAC